MYVFPNLLRGCRHCGSVFSCLCFRGVCPQKLRIYNVVGSFSSSLQVAGSLSNAESFSVYTYELAFFHLDPGPSSWFILRPAFCLFVHIGALSCLLGVKSVAIMAWCWMEMHSVVVRCNDSVNTVEIVGFLCMSLTHRQT